MTGETWAALVLAALIAGLWFVLLRSWLRTRKVGVDVAPELVAMADHDIGQVTLEVPGLFIGTTAHDDWLAFVGQGQLNERAKATLSVGADGVEIARDGATPLVITPAALRGVRSDSSGAGKVVESHGLVVLTWVLGDAELDSAFRPQRATDVAVVVAASKELLTRVKES